jgi:hypothetical protein
MKETSRVSSVRRASAVRSCSHTRRSSSTHGPTDPRTHGPTDPRTHDPRPTTHDPRTHGPTDPAVQPQGHPTVSRLVFRHRQHRTPVSQLRVLALTAKGTPTPRGFHAHCPSLWSRQNLREEAASRCLARRRTAPGRKRVAPRDVTVLFTGESPNQRDDCGG